MIISPTFCVRGRLSDLIVGIGNIKMIRSVTMLNDALKNQMTFFSRQWVVGVGDQNPDTGVQLKMLLVTAHIPQTPVQARMAQQERLMPRSTKSRRYCRTIEAFVKHSDAW
jgi:hypothetical protein